jgi:hypothetical protein
MVNSLLSVEAYYLQLMKGVFPWLHMLKVLVTTLQLIPHSYHLLADFLMTPIHKDVCKYLVTTADNAESSDQEIIKVGCSSAINAPSRTEEFLGIDFEDQRSIG